MIAGKVRPVDVPWGERHDKRGKKSGFFIEPQLGKDECEKDIGCVENHGEQFWGIIIFGENFQPAAQDDKIKRRMCVRRCESNRIQQSGLSRRLEREALIGLRVMAWDGDVNHPKTEGEEDDKEQPSPDVLFCLCLVALHPNFIVRI